jgi:hypothetical protein
MAGSRTHFHVVAVCRNSEQDGRRQTALVVDAGDGKRDGRGAHQQEPEGPVEVDPRVPRRQPTAMNVELWACVKTAMNLHFAECQLGTCLVTELVGEVSSNWATG